MPVVGEFHQKFWRARANAVVAPGPATASVYPKWQSTVHQAVSLSSAIWWLPIDVLDPWIEHLRWYLRLARRLWQWRVPANRALLETWIARLEMFDPEQHAVVERTVQILQGPYWGETRERVRGCATSPKFHQPEQWVAYSRAVKANAGQAQNVWRHLKVVQETQAAHPELSNPEAHLMAELAYQGLAAMGRADRQIVEHDKVVTH